MRMVSLSITDFELFKAQMVEEYKSASKFITDATERLSEKKIGNVSSNLPTMNFPPSILGTLPSAEKEPAFSTWSIPSQSSGRPMKVSNP